MDRVQLKQDAKDMLKGTWDWATPVTLANLAVIFVITGVAQLISQHGSNLVPLLLCFLAGYISWSLYIAFLHLRDNKEKTTLQPVLDGAYATLNNKHFGTILVTYAVDYVITFAWTLLLIIPGIIKAYAYAMAPFIMTDMIDSGKDIGITDAINKSQEIMKGHKMELFKLDLSFIGWLLLVGVTFGIASIWVMPYIYLTKANFYRKLAGNEFLD